MSTEEPGVGDVGDAAVLLRAPRKRWPSDHLEIETYTWDVLPEHLKTGDITEYVTRELEWTRDALAAARIS